MKNFNKTNKLMNIFERNSNYELEDKFKTDAKERQQMCRFCRKKFKSKELLLIHQTEWKDCISKLTREYILFNQV